MPVFEATVESEERVNGASSLAALRAMASEKQEGRVTLLNYHSDYLGGGGDFYWDSTLTALAYSSDTNGLFTTTGNHGWKSGQPVRLYGTASGGLSTLTTYYVIRLSATTFNLASTFVNATQPTPTKITNPSATSSGFVNVWDLGGYIIVPDSNPQDGRWRRMVPGGILHPAMFGAKGDGVTDATTAIANCYDAHYLHDMQVTWSGGGAYVCAPFTRYYAPRITGDYTCKVICSTSGSNQSVWAFEGSLGSIHAITASTVVNANTVTVSAANSLLYAVDDLIILGHDVSPKDDGVGGENTLKYRGQILRINAINTTTGVITVDEDIYFAFTSGANNAGVRKVNTIQDATITGVRMEFPDTNHQKGFIRLKYARRARVNIYGRRNCYAGINFHSCYDFACWCHAEEGLWIDAQQKYGYGVLAKSACAHGNVETISINGANSWTSSGEDNEWGEPYALDIRIVNRNSMSTGLTCHPHGHHLNFAAPQIFNPALDGIQIRCPYVTLMSAVIDNPGNHGIRIFDRGDYFTCYNHQIRNVPNGFQAITTSHENATDHAIQNGRMENVGNNCIRYNGASTDITIEGNKMRNYGKSLTASENFGVRFGGIATRPRVKNNIFEDDQGTVTSGPGLFLFNGANVDVQYGPNHFANGIQPGPTNRTGLTEMMINNMVQLGADQANNTTTIASITGLSFPVVAGVPYRFRAVILYTANATATGSRWSITGPASPTWLNYFVTMPPATTTGYPAATGETPTTRQFATYDAMTTAIASTPSNTLGNLVIIEGIIVPSAPGTVSMRFASEVAATPAITVKAGSTLQWF